MKLKIIKSPLYCAEDGIPAYKAGEWEGIKSNHFGRTRLILKQIRKDDNPSKIISKKIIPQKSSSEYVFRPSVKHVDSYYRNIQKKDNIKSGRRFIEPNSFRKTLKKSRCSSLKDIRPKDNITINNTIILPNISLKERPSKNYKKLHCSSSELNIENIMNKKKRTYSLEQQRNDYKEVNPGDKNYRYAEYSPDFFKGGGLIVGSTNKIRITDNCNYFKNNIYQTMELNRKIMDTEKIWRNKILKEREKNDSEYVYNLEKWEKEYIKENEKVTEKTKTKGNNKNEKDKKKVKIKI